MATGYSQMIATYNDHYFEDWINFISREFTLWEDDKRIILLSDEGDMIIGDLLLVEQSFCEKHKVVIKFRNAKGSAITAGLSRLTRSFVVEYYSMDELLDDEEHNMLYDCLLNRFVALSRHTQVGGFIFDRDGYTEDYIKVG